MNTQTAPAAYRGRFAPTPSGPLHFGSLVTALASYLEARAQGGLWLLRIEDLDPPRLAPGVADDTLRTLEAFGFDWDGPVVRQSERGADYQAALSRLIEAGAAYPCRCSRREIERIATRGPAGPVYPGTCRHAAAAEGGRQSWRLNTEGAGVGFIDALQGPRAIDVAKEVGDFVLRRADGVYAYHLASVVDDAAAGISHVVRGLDLLSCTPPQLLLQQRLGLPMPVYLHLPLAVTPAGQKLSKQSHARPLDCARAPALLAAALAFLGCPPPAGVADLATLWRWAHAHWDPARIPRRAAIPAPVLA